MFAETKKLKQARDSKSLVSLLIDTRPTFISYIDSAQKCVLVNALYALFFGRKIDEIMETAFHLLPRGPSFVA